MLLGVRQYESCASFFHYSLPPLKVTFATTVLCSIRGSGPGRAPVYLTIRFKNKTLVITTRTFFVFSEK